MQPATEIACHFDIVFLRRERKTAVADTGVLSVLVYHRATRGGCPLGNARRRFFHWRLAPFPFTGPRLEAAFFQPALDLVLGKAEV